MKFSEVVTQTLAWLQREGRVSYRALKREFDLDDEFLADVKEEIIEVKRLAIDENGKVLVWKGINEGAEAEGETAKRRNGETEKDFGPRTSDAGRPAAERRQLTVLFCDLVGSTALSARLDPEDYRRVVQQYQQICAEVIQRHEGYLAQYLGDGLLVYFGYPTAHEDDARRAVRTGLEIVAALQRFAPSLALAGEGWGEGYLQVRIGIHTGLVVVGEIGSGDKRELLALGETPNIAARIQGLAEPNTVIISTATQRLIGGQFESQPFGSHLVKGIDHPIAVYYVQSERQSTSPLAGKTLTPLVGREQEVGLLIDRWEQVKEGRGQVVLLSGEPGIGKSRLASTLREHVTSQGSLLFEARCSPYHQHSALYPLIDMLQRTLLFIRQNTDDEKVAKLERGLALYDMQESLPLFTVLLSLPTPSQYPPLTLTSQKQKERTLQALVQLLIAQAERQATVSVWEDLHWADPSSLESLSLLIEQIPTSKLLLVLTFRPEFIPPWKPRSHISQLVLNRLGKKQVEAMIEKVSGQEAISADVLQQIVAKTDGVPLFVEELTKSVVESVGGRGSRAGGRDGKPGALLTIPATLQEALLARLDRLSTARQIAQLGATLGRDFSYELLQAVAPINETDLQTALTKLVEAEILYQRGVGEQARYFFKHALIQDTAYQSLLKSTRQQYHQQIAQILEERFPDTKANQPELLAHHYTEAGLIEQAILYWQRAGQRASQGSAHAEAISHLSTALELLQVLPETVERDQQELMLHLTLRVPLQATKGVSSPELQATYTRARTLCQQVGEPRQLFPVLSGLRTFHQVRGELVIACELGEQLLSLVQQEQDPAWRIEAYCALGSIFFALGKFGAARAHLAQGLALYDTQRHCSPEFFYGGVEPGVFGLSEAARALWYLGYPAQALQQSQAARTLAHERAHPFSLAVAQVFAALVHQLRRENALTYEWADAVVTLTRAQGFPVWLGQGMVLQGWALAERGQLEEGISQIRQGLTTRHAVGASLSQSYNLALLAEAHGKAGQIDEGLIVLTEALNIVDKVGERFYQAELYRLRGELTLAQPSVQSLESRVKEAEECFLKAIDISRHQQAKSLELRAATNLVRLWQQQGKRAEAHKLLSDVYNWFTEGFDTKDLQEAKALIEELSH